MRHPLLLLSIIAALGCLARAEEPTLVPRTNSPPVPAGGNYNLAFTAPISTLSGVVSLAITDPDGDSITVRLDANHTYGITLFSEAASSPGNPLFAGGVVVISYPTATFPVRVTCALPGQYQVSFSMCDSLGLCNPQLLNLAITCPGTTSFQQMYDVITPPEAYTVQHLTPTPYSVLDQSKFIYTLLSLSTVNATDLFDSTKHPYPLWVGQSFNASASLAIVCYSLGPTTAIFSLSWYGITFPNNTFVYILCDTAPTWQVTTNATCLANTPHRFVVVPNDADITRGDTLTYSLTKAPAKGKVCTSPSSCASCVSQGASFSFTAGASNTLYYLYSTPRDYSAAATNFTISATDAQGISTPLTLIAGDPVGRPCPTC